MTDFSPEFHAAAQRRRAARQELKEAESALRPLVQQARRQGASLRRLAAATGLSINTVQLWSK